MDNSKFESVPIVKNKPKSIKITAVFLIILLILIGLTIFVAGFFGPNMLNFTLMGLIFLLPLIIIYRNSFLSFLPEFIKNNLNIVEEKEEDTEKKKNPIKYIKVETDRNDYLKMILCFICVAAALVFIFDVQMPKLPQTQTQTQTQTQPASVPQTGQVYRTSNLRIPTPDYNTRSLASSGASSTSSGSSTSTSSTSTRGGAMPNNKNLGLGFLFTLIGLYISSQTL